MTLPFNLQKLPPEALDTLRYMGKTARPVQPEEIEEGASLSYRLVGKAIRRLINGDYIQIDISNGSYHLTTDGEEAVKQLVAYDEQSGHSVAPKAAAAPVATRR